jgi:hypothetical protein
VPGAGRPPVTASMTCLASERPSCARATPCRLSHATCPARSTSCCSTAPRASTRQSWRFSTRRAHHCRQCRPEPRIPASRPIHHQRLHLSAVRRGCRTLDAHMLTLTGQITSGPSGQFILRCQARGEKPGRTVSEPLEPAPNVLGPYAHDPRGPRTHSGRHQPEKPASKRACPGQRRPTRTGGRRSPEPLPAPCQLPWLPCQRPLPSWPWLRWNG